jgi:hypothetical protein
MSSNIRIVALTSALLGAVALTSAQAAEREQVRAVINLVTGIKMPYPENLPRNRAKTQRVWLEINGATIACMRLEARRWCYEHIPPLGARAEMLRIRSEPAGGVSIGQLYHYVDDFDLDGAIDIGSTTKIESIRDGTREVPIATVIQFFHRSTNRGNQYRADYQKMYDEGIDVALKNLGE